MTSMVPSDGHRWASSCQVFVEDPEVFAGSADLRASR